MPARRAPGSTDALGPGEHRAGSPRVRSSAAPGPPPETPREDRPARPRCPCGGGCPVCAGAAAAGRRPPAPAPAARAPRRTGRGPFRRDAAEHEAHRLAPLVLHRAASARDGPSTSPAQGSAGTARGEPTAWAHRPRAPPRGRIRACAPPDARLGAGRPLSRHERDGFEHALEHDLSPVRIHAGPTAAGLADDRHALAFTYGTHIVLGAAAPGSGRGLDAVLAHELIHVVHQAADQRCVQPGRSETTARGPPCVPALRTPVHPQDLEVPGFIADAASEVADFGGDVVEFGGDVVGATADAALAVGGLVLEGAEEVIDYLAPGLLDFLRGDVFEQLESLFCRGVDTLVSTLLAPLADIDVMSGIETFFRGLTAGVEAAYGALGATASTAVGMLLRPVLVVVDVFGEDLIGLVQGFSDAVTSVFTALWDHIAAPVLTFLGDVGGAVLETFTGLVTWLWDVTRPVRDTAEWAWNWLMEQFGLAWESTSGVRGWLEEKATAAWETFLEAIEPIKTPLMAVGGILLLLSPLGPIVLLTQVLPPVWDKLTWLAANWQDTEVVVRARGILANDVLPFLIGVVDSLKQLIAAAAGWLAGAAASVARGMAVLVGLFSTSECLASVNRILDHVADQFERLQLWAENGFAGLGAAVGALFETLRTVFQPILDFLVRLALVAANPPLLPVAIAGAIWLLLPDEFKPPVITFVLGLLIAFLSGFPAFLTGLGPLAAVLKSATLGFLRHLRSGEGVGDQTRIDASNKAANLMAGGGPQFIAGYAIGLVHGLVEGIIDPFRLLFMLFELVVAAIRVLKRVLAPFATMLAPAPITAGIHGLEEAMAIPPPSGGGGTPAPTEAGARAPPEAAAAPAAEISIAVPGPAEGAAGSAGAPVAATATATIGPAEGPATTEAGQDGSTTPDPAASGGAAETAIFAGEDVETDEQVARRLPPDVVAGVVAEAEPQDVSADELTADMRTEVQATSGSVSTLASLLGEVWEWLMTASGRLGARIAVGLLELLGLPDFVLGRKLGWLSGMILLEVLIAYFTAGGYTVLKQGASLGRRLLSYLLRFLDIGGEILGVLGRALAPLKGPILRGFGAAKGFLSRFGFIRGLFDRIEALARRIFRFGDDAAARAPGRVGGAAPAPRAGVPEAGVPAPRARLPEAGAPAPRAGVPEPGAPTRPARDAAEELGDGSFRAVDEPGVPQVRDDVRKAAQLAEADIAARTIVRTNDVVDTPVPLVLGLLMMLKRRYRWIDTFRADVRGPGSYEFVMVASERRIGTYTIDVDGRQVEVSRRRGGSRPEPASRATPAQAVQLPPGVHASPLRSVALERIRRLPAAEQRALMDRLALLQGDSGRFLTQLGKMSDEEFDNVAHLLHRRLNPATELAEGAESAGRALDDVLIDLDAPDISLTTRSVPGRIDPDTPGVTRGALKGRMRKQGLPNWAMNRPLRDWNPHHIIPVQFEHHSVFDVLRANGGWDHNSPLNGIALPTRAGIPGAGSLPVHQVDRRVLAAPRRPEPDMVLLRDLGGHPVWNERVGSELDALYEAHWRDPVRLRAEVARLLDRLRTDITTRPRRVLF